MEWVKVELRTTRCGAEIITGTLLASGVAGTEIIDAEERVRHLAERATDWDYAEEGLLAAASDDVFVIFYVTKDMAGEKLLADVCERLEKLKTDNENVGFLGLLEISTTSADDSAWLDEWKKHFKPLRIGRVLIVPQWEEAPDVSSDTVVFTIDPGSAFGTGQHETTQLCISALQEFRRGAEPAADADVISSEPGMPTFLSGDTVLDIGCGSGILSIIALLLGAREVFACDIDPAGAIAATKKNARLNSVDITRLHIFAGDALAEDFREKICDRKYEVVVANIVADVVIELVPLVCEILTDTGVFIASGIINERAGEVERAFAESGLKIVKKLESGDWCCFVGAQEKRVLSGGFLPDKPGALSDKARLLSKNSSLLSDKPGGGQIRDCCRTARPVRRGGTVFRVRIEDLL